jgi:hypothetical protein
VVTQSVVIIREELLNQVTAENVQKVAGKALASALRQATENLPSLSDATLSWFKQYQKGRFEVYLDTSGMSKEVNKLGRIGRQAVIAVILVGLIIGSAIATIGIGLGGLQGAFWNLITQIAVLSYVLSSLVAAVIVLRLVWHWLRGSDPDSD